MKFLISLLISLFLWLPVVILGLFILPILLLTSWDGKTTWWGNYLYGREGNHHMPDCPDFWDRWWFLGIRNPASNFGKFTLSLPFDSSIAWLEESHLFGSWYIKYGWKEPDERLPGSRRAFLFRPWKHDTN